MQRHVVVGSVALIALVANGAPATADTLTVGDRAVELDVAVDRKGKAFKLAALRGRWLLVTVGAEWCAPCKKELPVWDKLAAEHAGRITFVALSLDDSTDDGKRFHRTLGLAHMLLAYMPEEKSAVAATYGAATMPSTFIIDPRGVVRYVRAGFEARDPDGEYRAMKATIAKLLGPAPTPRPKPEPTPEPKPAPTPEPTPDPPGPAPAKPAPDPIIKLEPEPTADPDTLPAESAPAFAHALAPFDRFLTLAVGLGGGFIVHEGSEANGNAILGRGAVAWWWKPQFAATARVLALRGTKLSRSMPGERTGAVVATLGIEYGKGRITVGAGFGVGTNDDGTMPCVEGHATWTLWQSDVHAITLAFDGALALGDDGFPLVALVAGYQYRL